MNSFIRFRSLGEDFTEENLKKVIAGEKESPERNEKVPDRKEAKPEKRKFDLVVDIQEKMAQGKNGGYVQWAKKYNVKQFAESILFLQQHDIHDKETLDALVDGSSVKYHELMKTIKDAEEKMAANKVIKSHIINYAKTRETYIAYRKSGYSKKFYEAHRDEITLHKAAKEAFSKLPDGKIPKVKDLNEEFARLLSEKKAAYSEYKKIKKEIQFKLYPYKASGKTQAPIVYNLEDVVTGFFREASNKVTEPILFEELCKNLMDDVDVADEDMDYFKDMIQSLFFRGSDFIADNLGLYPYQTTTNNKSADNLAHFLYSVMGISEEDCKKIEVAKSQYQFNVLEDMVIKNIESRNVCEAEKKQAYFIVKDDIQELFKADFSYMLESGMTSLEDLSNLFAVYYFYYISQTSVILDQFCTGKRDSKVTLYYALDWEKVSKNRQCCIEGWEKIQENLNHMFSHAITLEILNQTQSDEMVDYISLAKLANEPGMDSVIAAEVKKAEETYCSYVGDYKGFSDIQYPLAGTETDKAVNHLFKCVYQQFLKKDAVLELIEKSGIKYEINGNQDYCMPNTINLSITGVESEALMLSSKQFCGISNGSACTSHEYSPSYVLTAMGLDADRISSAIRISWGAHTDKDELINELSELIAVAKSLVF